MKGKKTRNSFLNFHKVMRNLNLNHSAIALILEVRSTRNFMNSLIISSSKVLLSAPLTSQQLWPKIGLSNSLFSIL